MLINKYLGKDSVLVFLVVFVLLLPSFVINCNIYSNLNFDSQAFLTWLYAAEKNYMPYRDVFYPYGFFLFYKQTNLTLTFIDLILKTSLYVFYYQIFKFIFTNKLYSIAGFFFFVLFVFEITSVDIFLRYGLLVAFSITSFLAYYANLLNARRTNFLLGLFCSGVFCIFPDQGAYAFLIYFFILIAKTLRGNSRASISSNAKSSVSALIWFIVGNSIFFGPFLIFLYENEALTPFINSFSEYKNIVLLAKIPFPPSLFSIDNIFTISVLILTISVLSQKLFVHGEKFAKADYVGIGLIVSIFLLEQKNVARSIDLQLTFLGFLLFCYLFSFFANKAKQANFILFFLTVCVLLIFVAGFKANSTFLRSENIMNLEKSSSCISQNLNYNQRANSYLKVFNKISAYEGSRSIFSYPQDPIFYVLFNQKTPYYFSVYESSYLGGQNRMVDYLNQIRSEYVIINLQSAAIQDSVPDVVRGNKELAYILRNYIFKEKVGDFLILQRSLESDYFRSEGWNNSTWSKQLLEVDLGAIPYTEARDKKNYLGSPIRSFSNIEQLNLYLNKVQVNTFNKFILFRTDTNEQVHLNIRVDSSLVTSVSLTNCKNSCLVHFDRLPLLFSPKLLFSLEAEKKYQISDIQLFESDSSLFW